VDFKHFATLMVPMMPEEDEALLHAETLADGRRFTDADSLDAMILRCVSAPSCSIYSVAAISSHGSAWSIRNQQSAIMQRVPGMM
jgi:hypothetical protein